MRESIRAVLAESEAVIRRTRERIASETTATAAMPSLHAGESGTHDERDEQDATATALRIADEWERYALDVADEANLDDAARRFRARWPALVRWREQVLRTPRRAKPRVLAAAYESLAVECTLAGEHELAARAQHAAIDLMREAMQRRANARQESSMAEPASAPGR